CDEVDAELGKEGMGKLVVVVFKFFELTQHLSSLCKFGFGEVGEEKATHGGEIFANLVKEIEKNGPLRSEDLQYRVRSHPTGLVVMCKVATLAQRTELP